MDSIYALVDWQLTDEGAQSIVELDPHHPIFGGHFPGIPVLPGACMVQISHDLVDKFLNKNTIFIKANQIKFLQMVNPNEIKRLTSKLKVTETEEDLIKVDHTLSNGEMVVFKFSGVYKPNLA